MISDFLPLLFPLIATGILSGFVAGLLGVGGGIIIAPIIAYLLTSHGLHTHMPMHVAIGSSLAVIVPTSIISARTHTRLSNVDFDVVRRLGPVVFLGAMGGAVVASWLDNHSLKIIFGLLALMMSILFLIKMVEIRTDLPSFGPRVYWGCDWFDINIGGDRRWVFDRAHIKRMRVVHTPRCRHVRFDGDRHCCAWDGELYDRRRWSCYRFALFQQALFGGLLSSSFLSQLIYGTFRRHFVGAFATKLFAYDLWYLFDDRWQSPYL